MLVFGELTIARACVIKPNQNASKTCTRIEYRKKRYLQREFVKIHSSSAWLTGMQEDRFFHVRGNRGTLSLCMHQGGRKEYFKDLGQQQISWLDEE